MGRRSTWIRSVRTSVDGVAGRTTVGYKDAMVCLNKMFGFARAIINTLRITSCRDSCREFAPYRPFRLNYASQMTQETREEADAYIYIYIKLAHHGALDTNAGKQRTRARAAK